MTAHIEPLSHDCQAPNCKTPRTYRVYNQWNWNEGDFCEDHAKAKLEKLQQEEKEMKQPCN